MVKPTLRTKSIGTKVTEEEYARLERAAQAGSKTLGEWCREVMLASANGQIATCPKIGRCRSPGAHGRACGIANHSA